MMKRVALVIIMVGGLSMGTSDFHSSQGAVEDSTLSYDSLFQMIKGDDANFFEIGLVFSKLGQRDGEAVAMRHFITRFAHLDEAKTPTVGLLLPILPRLAWIRVEHQAQAAVPLLQSKDPAVRETADNLLTWIHHNRLEHSNWDFYREYLSEQQGRPPDYFINYLMSGSPPLALELFGDFYGSRHRDPEGESLTHEAEVARRTLEYHVWMIQHGPSELENVEAARQALADLLDLDRWWASIFVAEAANHHQQLRTAELGRRLLAVEEPLVRQRLDWAREAGLGAEGEIKSEEADQGHGVPPPPRPAPSDDEINSEEADQGDDR